MNRYPVRLGIYDRDLRELLTNGIPIKRLMLEALTAYAYGHEYHVYVGDPMAMACDIKMIKDPVTLYLSVKDERVISLLEDIRPRKRGAFIKALVRSAFISMPVGHFFDKNSANYRSRIRKESDRLHRQERPKNLYIPMAEITSESGQIKEVKKEEKKAPERENLNNKREQGERKIQDQHLRNKDKRKIQPKDNGSNRPKADTDNERGRRQLRSSEKKDRSLDTEKRSMPGDRFNGNDHHDENRAKPAAQHETVSVENDTAEKERTLTEEELEKIKKSWAPDPELQKRLRMMRGI